MLPSIRQLAREQKVSVITVQRGYENLEREGLIHSRRGKGFFVSEIHKDAKKEMAVQRLTEMVKPQIKLAKEEGMTKEEIRKIFDELLKNI